MSWLYSRALVAEFLEENSLDGEPCAPLNVMLTQHPFWHRDKTTDFLSHSLFGPMSAHLTADRGEELLMWFLAGFRARTSAPQEKARASKASDQDCGWKWRESSVKYDPATCSWKTRQCSLLGDSEPYSETWPRWGLMRDGECWERPTLAPPISENGSGLLPTLLRPNGGRSVKHVTDWRGNTAYHNGKKVQVDLKAAIQRMPTLRKTDAERGGRGDLIQAIRGNENKHFKMHPTLTVHGNYNRKGASKNSGDGLATSLRNGQAESNTSGPLNPEWCDWYMGFPMGWTALESLETHRSHNAPLKHGAC